MRSAWGWLETSRDLKLPAPFANNILIKITLHSFITKCMKIVGKLAAILFRGLIQYKDAVLPVFADKKILRK